MDKTHHGSVIALFFCETSAAFLAYVGGDQLFFSVGYWQVYFGYSANNNTRGAFAILFFICSDLLNCLRGHGTKAITTGSD